MRMAISSAMIAITTRSSINVKACCLRTAFALLLQEDSTRLPVGFSATIIPLTVVAMQPRSAVWISVFPPPVDKSLQNPNVLVECRSFYLVGTIKYELVNGVLRDLSVTTSA